MAKFIRSRLIQTDEDCFARDRPDALHNILAEMNRLTTKLEAVFQYIWHEGMGSISPLDLSLVDGVGQRLKDLAGDTTITPSQTPGKLHNILHFSFTF